MGVPLEGIYLVVRSDCYDVIKKMIGGKQGSRLGYMSGKKKTNNKKRREEIKENAKSGIIDKKTYLVPGLLCVYAENRISTLTARDASQVNLNRTFLKNLNARNEHNLVS